MESRHTRDLESGKGTIARTGWRSLLWPGPLSTRQLLYLIFPQTIGAVIIDGGANFGIAYAMYHKQTLIEIWPIQHNTIAGDMAVTTFIQGILTFLIVSGMVHGDVRSGLVPPLPHPWPCPHERRTDLEDEGSPTPKHHAVHFFCGSEDNDVFDFSIPIKQIFYRWFRTILEGACLSAVYFLILWPIGIAIVAPLYQQRNNAQTWIPEIIKLVYAAVLGLIMNPICALIALGSEHALHRRHAPLLDTTEPETRQVSRGPSPVELEEESRPHSPIPAVPISIEPVVAKPDPAHIEGNGDRV